MKSLFFLLSVTLLSTPVMAAKARDFVKDYKRPTSIPAPKDNPITPAKVELGKQLFFDPRLSGSGWISCATCHNPAFGWEDGLKTGFGHGMKKLGRHSPTILNLAYGELFMWDGRKESLEAQALGPIEAGVEMNMNLDDMVEKVKSLTLYQKGFAKAFPGENITADLVGKAIATFERTIVSGEAPFDKFVKGDNNAISSSAKRGFVLFNTKAACNQCHSGWRFTDDSFHDIGVNSKDEGRFAQLPLDSMKHAFKTPTLRNIAQRAPYTHNGSEETMEDIVELYNQGGRVKRPSISPLVKKLNLTKKEKGDLVEFMKSLTSKDADITVPRLTHM